MNRGPYSLCLFFICALVGCAWGCASPRNNNDRVIYYFTAHPNAGEYSDAYSEKIFLLVQKISAEYGFEYRGRRDQDGQMKAFLFYDESKNVACYYTWDTMRITIKTQPFWRFSKEFPSFLTALHKNLQENGFRYRYETKLFPSPILTGGITNFSGRFVTENDNLMTEYCMDEYPLPQEQVTRGNER